MGILIIVKTYKFCQLSHMLDIFLSSIKRQKMMSRGCDISTSFSSLIKPNLERLTKNDRHYDIILLFGL